MTKLQGNYKLQNICSQNISLIMVTDLIIIIILCASHLLLIEDTETGPENTYDDVYKIIFKLIISNHNSYLKI